MSKDNPISKSKPLNFIRASSILHIAKITGCPAALASQSQFDKWVVGNVWRYGGNPYCLQAKGLRIPERTEEVKFDIDLGFSYLVKEKTVDVKVDVNGLSAAVDNRFNSDVLDGQGCSVFGYYVDRIDVSLALLGLIGGRRACVHPRMESSEVVDTKEVTSGMLCSVSLKLMAKLELAKKRGREKKILTMGEVSFVDAKNMDAVGFRWEVICWEHNNALEYNRIEPERVWHNSSAVSRRQIKLPYAGDGPGIQKDSF